MGCNHRRFLSALVALAFLWTVPGRACSTFELPHSKGKIVGKSFDWHQDHGMAFVNPRGLEKVAFALDPRLVPAKWTAKYGSITLNQYGREMPIGGINEAGLVVENMMLDETEYPLIGSQPTANEVQWIQYQLDNFKSVTEMLHNVDKLRVANVYAKLHYLACDKSGECATVEWVGKELVSHRLCATCGAPAFVLTNDTYDKSVDYLKTIVGFGGTDPMPKGVASLTRFVTAAKRIQEWRQPPTATAVDDVQYAFETLDQLRQSGQLGSTSRWNNVYDRETMKVYFRTNSNPDIKWFSVNAFDFSCKTAKSAKMLEMNAGLQGEVTAKFVDYDRAANKVLISKSFQHIEPLLPPGSLDRLAVYPETFHCAE